MTLDAVMTRLEVLEARIAALEAENSALKAGCAVKPQARPVTEAAFMEALNGMLSKTDRSQVRISQLRDVLGWNDDDFNQMVQALERKMKIVLYADYLGTLTIEERDRGYIDENGRAKFYISFW